MYIHGKNVVAEGLKNNPEIFIKVYFSSSSENENLQSKVKSLKIPFDFFDPKNPPHKIKETDQHQGVIAEIDENKLLQKYPTFIKNLAGEIDDPVFLLKLIHEKKY